MTCGEGQQTREVSCVGAEGQRLADHACSGLARPHSVQTCRRPACHMQVSWHVTEYGLVSKETSFGKQRIFQLLHCCLLLSLQCTRSCSGGVRERRVGCFDIDLNPYPESRCGTAGRPVSVEECNTQPCPGVQSEQSVNNLFNCVFYLFAFLSLMLFFPLVVPSVQDPSTVGSTTRGFVPHVPGEPLGMRRLVPLQA